MPRKALISYLAFFFLILGSSVRCEPVNVFYDYLQPNIESGITPRTPYVPQDATESGFSSQLKYLISPSSGIVGNNEVSISVAHPENPQSYTPLAIRNLGFVGHSDSSLSAAPLEPAFFGPANFHIAADPGFVGHSDVPLSIAPPDYSQLQSQPIRISSTPGIIGQVDTSLSLSPSEASNLQRKAIQFPDVPRIIASGDIANLNVGPIYKSNPGILGSEDISLSVAPLENWKTASPELKSSNIVNTVDYPFIVPSIQQFHVSPPTKPLFDAAGILASNEQPLSIAAPEQLYSYYGSNPPGIVGNEDVALGVVPSEESYLKLTPLKTSAPGIVGSNDASLSVSPAEQWYRQHSPIQTISEPGIVGTNDAPLSVSQPFGAFYLPPPFQTSTGIVSNTDIALGFAPAEKSAFLYKPNKSITGSGAKRNVPLPVSLFTQSVWELISSNDGSLKRAFTLTNPSEDRKAIYDFTRHFFEIAGAENLENATNNVSHAFELVQDSLTVETFAKSSVGALAQFLFKKGLLKADKASRTARELVDTLLQRVNVVTSNSDSDYLKALTNGFLDFLAPLEVLDSNIDSVSGLFAQEAFALTGTTPPLDFFK